MELRWKATQMKIMDSAEVFGILASHLAKRELLASYVSDDPRWRWKVPRASNASQPKKLERPLLLEEWSHLRLQGRTD